MKFVCPKPCLLIWFALPMWSQTFMVGLKAGVPFSSYFETGLTGSLHGGAQYSSATRRYTLGAAAELRLTRAFGFEVDALYHRLGYAGLIHFFDSANGNYSNSSIHVTGNSWDFPLLLKYRFGRLVRPYVAGGGVL